MQVTCSESGKHLGSETCDGLVLSPLCLCTLFIVSTPSRCVCVCQLLFIFKFERQNDKEQIGRKKANKLARENLPYVVHSPIAHNS